MEVDPESGFSTTQAVRALINGDGSESTVNSIIIRSAVDVQVNTGSCCNCNEMSKAQLLFRVLDGDRQLDTVPKFKWGETNTKPWPFGRKTSSWGQECDHCPNEQPSEQPPSNCRLSSFERQTHHNSFIIWCPEGDLNPHDRLRSADFKSAASADFAIRAILLYEFYRNKPGSQAEEKPSACHFTGILFQP